LARIAYRIAETEAEREGYFAVRQAVFVDEQHIFAGTDVDQHDARAVHIVAVNEDTGDVIGAVRCYEGEGGTWYGGRLAVSKECRRGVGIIGPRLVKLAEEIVRERGCRRFIAYVQLQNVRFFEHLGWRSVGVPEPHYGQPHQTMEADLSLTTTPVRLLVHA
jgi:putative N-acetyltransferase (TIGR04045 family)